MMVFAETFSNEEQADLVINKVYQVVLKCRNNYFYQLSF